MELKLKWLCAATLAACASVAQADVSVVSTPQFNASVYGTLDIGVLYQSTTATTFLPNMPSNGSVIRFQDGGIYASDFGIKASQQFADDYTIGAQLQGAFNTGTGKIGLSDTPGQTSVFNQIATISVAGPFGSITGGRQIIPLIYAMGETDVRECQYFGSLLSAWLGINQAAGWPGTSTNGPIGALYDSNAIVYQTPNLQGLPLHLNMCPVV